MAITGIFWCENCNCGASGKEKDFELEYNQQKTPVKMKCPNNGRSILKHMGDKSMVFAINKSTHSKGRTTAEKEKRRSTDFIKNTLPSLPPGEQRHFKQKFKKKGLL